MKPLKNVAVFSNVRPRDQEVAGCLRSALKEAGLCPDREPYDLIISVGGDGTFLESVRRYGHLGVPLAGINTGSLGFLQENTPQDAECLVGALASGDYHLESFPLLRVRSEPGAAATWAFNDVVVERFQTRMLHLEVSIDGGRNLEVVGDGLIVSTAAGSTAYAAAAGGPYIDPAVPVMQLVPISPHPTQVYRSLAKPVVVGAESRLRIRARPDKPRDFRVVVDGAEWTRDQPSYLDILGSGGSLQVLRRENRPFCERLADKFLGR